MNVISRSLIVVVFVVGIFLGTYLGALLGKVGTLEILALALRTPHIIIKSPRKLKAKWRIWRKIRLSRKMDVVKRKKEIAELMKKIKELKEEIRQIKTQIRRARWVA